MTVNRTVRRLRTVPDEEIGPSAAELDAIEVEWPVIAADVELLDARIAVLDRVPTEVDRQRIRRAHRRLLSARRELANRFGTPEVA
ncbi:DUF6284 family protein [Streptomyces sp. NBC_01775]|uniref:DUF6284 family protein n=1 Tax=Streptomyces sp. NBC_01775 TaxID=2975939 RepID=UPI002DDB42AD|nr:DUF6284 family protein [Streptomyces sp. NBC_01775]WSB77633.1 DUF6284 family protein [Streptomyces sp. NBC_01775]